MASNFDPLLPAICLFDATSIALLETPHATPIIPPSLLITPYASTSHPTPISRQIFSHASFVSLSTPSHDESFGSTLARNTVVLPQIREGKSIRGGFVHSRHTPHPSLLSLSSRACSRVSFITPVSPRVHTRDTLERERERENRRTSSSSSSSSKASSILFNRPSGDGVGIIPRCGRSIDERDTAQNNVSEGIYDDSRGSLFQRPLRGPLLIDAQGKGYARFLRSD